ncbi:hypothetical protein PM082_019794 [Marasmius tenuissimus]|nr:hypothetical protein PM082_019794 [Marasmius tenuissimus]
MWSQNLSRTHVPLRSPSTLSTSTECTVYPIPFLARYSTGHGTRKEELKVRRTSGSGLEYLSWRLRRGLACIGSMLSIAWLRVTCTTKTISSIGSNTLGIMGIPNWYRLTVIVVQAQRILWRRHATSDSNRLGFGELELKRIHRRVLPKNLAHSNSEPHFQVFTRTISPAFPRSLTSGSNSATNQSKLSRGIARMKVDSRDVNFTRPTQSTITVSNLAINRSQLSQRAVISTPNKPKKQPEPEDRKVTQSSARTTRSQRTRTNGSGKEAWR